MSPNHQITMLKFIKNLSMLSTTLDSLQNSNAIDVLTDLLRSKSKESHFTEISNQVLNTIYNLCRLNKSRQEDAALNGIIPVLQRIIKTERPLKEFALPVLCDMAQSGKVGRRELWRNKGLPFYISLLADPYWQVTALDAIFIWLVCLDCSLANLLIVIRLQEETAKVEEHLLDGSFTKAVIKCFTTSKANAFENLLEPLQKLLRLSPPIALTLADPDLFCRILHKLQSSKPVVRLNLLRIIRSICDASDQQGDLITRYGLIETIQRLSETDGAVLVRNMASELVRSSETNDKIGMSGGRRRPARRTSSSFTPPSLLTSVSVPQTPTSSRSTRCSSHFNERNPKQPTATGGATLYRPVSEDGANTNNFAVSPQGSGVMSKSRLPRTKSGRPSMLTTSSKEVNIMPTNNRHEGVVPAPAPNSRRRRRVSDERRQI
jgi:hypothetical protein